jgi:hypothetical protein
MASYKGRLEVLSRREERIVTNCERIAEDIYIGVKLIDSRTEVLNRKTKSGVMGVPWEFPRADESYLRR